jgi:hypothetical protein
VCEELSQDAYGLRAQWLTLGAEPVLERSRLEAETLEEVAAIQICRFLERLGCPAGNASFESCDVHDRPGRLEADEVSLGHDRFDVGGDKRVAEVGEALA